MPKSFIFRTPPCSDYLLHLDSVRGTRNPLAVSCTCGCGRERRESKGIRWRGRRSQSRSRRVETVTGLRSVRAKALSTERSQSARQRFQRNMGWDRIILKQRQTSESKSHTKTGRGLHNETRQQNDCKATQHQHTASTMPAKDHSPPGTSLLLTPAST